MLSELLSTERVRVPLGSHSKADLLRELVHLALGDADEETVRGVLAAVELREAEVSTAMGRGLAIPHGRTEFVDAPHMAAGLVEGVRDYASPDGSPVRVVFLVVTPPGGATTHVRILSRIARLMHQPESQARLLGARTAGEFVAAIGTETSK